MLGSGGEDFSEQKKIQERRREFSQPGACALPRYWWRGGRLSLSPGESARARGGGGRRANVGASRGRTGRRCRPGERRGRSGPATAEPAGHAPLLSCAASWSTPAGGGALLSPARGPGSLPPRAAAGPPPPPPPPRAPRDRIIFISD